MDRDELHLREAATGQRLSLRKYDDGTWSVGAPPSTERLVPGRPVEVSETFISDDRVRLKDGRTFKRRMTSDELREALGLIPGEE